VCGICFHKLISTNLLCGNLNTSLLSQGTFSQAQERKHRFGNSINIPALFAQVCIFFALTQISCHFFQLITETTNCSLVDSGFEHYLEVFFNIPLPLLQFEMLY